MTTETTTRPPLTDRQAEAYEFIKSTQLYGPAIREIAQHLQVTTNAAVGHVKALERKGYIRRTPNVARGIEVVR